MVSFVAKGRMGNFMFIAAAAYMYSIRNHLHFHVPYESLAPHLWPVYLQHLQNENWNPDLERIYVNDDGHKYKPLPYKEEWKDKNIIIGTQSVETGYFQSYKYTENYLQTIRFMFGFQFKKQYGTVGIHVRRGDYLNYPDKHPVVTAQYILYSVNDLKKSGARIYKYKFFSDDIAWCKEFFLYNPDVFKGYTVEFSEGKTEYEDMEELMNCQFLVISNSSFSVFSAMLNPHPEKKVYCPHEDNYFGIENKHLDVSTLYPASFLRIKY